MSERRTIRRYAHELYPNPAEGEVRPLSVEVPYLYARAWGLDVDGTGWQEVEPRSAAGDRAAHAVNARRIALMADAMLQGLTGDDAYRWVVDNDTPEGFTLWRRAVRHGVPIDRIKPYPCGPEPTEHYHNTKTRNSTGVGTLIPVKGRESECDACTEPIPTEPTEDDQ